MPLMRKLPVAHIDEIPLGRTKHFRFGYTEGIAYNDGGTLKAYINKCTHMGGPLELQATSAQPVFRCRWHEAEFNSATGEAMRGEAPAKSFLTPIKLVVEGKQIYALLELPDDPFAF